MERIRALSLRARLLLLALVGAIPALVIIAYTAVNQRDDAFAQAERRTRAMVNATAREHDHLFIVTRELLKDLASLPALSDTTTTSHCRHILNEATKSHPYYINLAVAAPNGTVFCSAVQPRRPVSMAGFSFFKQAYATKSLSVGDYQLSPFTGEITLHIGYPLLGASREVKAVLFAALDVTWINQLLTKVDLPVDGTLALLDSHGTVVAHHPDPGRWIGVSMKDHALFRAIQKQSGEGTEEVLAFDDERMLVTFSRLTDGANGALYIVGAIPSAVISESVKRSLYRNLLVLGMAALLALAATWFGANFFILRRMSALSAAGRRLREGDLSARTGLTHGGDEFGRLAATFDTMAESLERRQQEVSRSTRALRALTAATRTIARATSEQDLLDSMCRVMVMVGGYGVAWIGYAFDDERKTVERVSHAGLSDSTLERLDKYPKASWADNECGQEPVGMSIRTGAPIVVRDIQNDPGHAPWREEVKTLGFAAAAGFPLTINGKIIGAIGIYASEAGSFDAEELRLLQEMADDLAYGIAIQRSRIEHARAHETIRRMAFYDPLTELPNHAHLEELLKQMFEPVDENGGQNALLLVDINGFREINEAVGLHQANMVLKEIGPRLRALVREQDIVARMRSDEFAVVLPGASADHAIRMADRIRRVLNVRFALGSISIDITVSIGIVMFPEQGREIETLVRRADTALYHARRSTHGYAAYAPSLEKNTSQRLSLAADLREAIEGESPALEFYYQPKIDVASGRVGGLEALARWRHAGNGMIPPDQFIAVAESTGLIGPLTERLLVLAARQSHLWAAEGIRLPIAVNLSARNLQDDLFFEKIRNIRDEFSERRMLEFEITESALMTDPTRSLEVLTKLHLLGIPLYVDDFGTGYSSLAYLQKLPVDAIKVDKSFVIDMLRSRDSATIVQSVITLAHDLGLKVVAEGVEAAAVLTRLHALGCDIAQGYHIAKPMPAGDVAAWLNAWSPKARKKPSATRPRRTPSNK